ncbi:hypothetical protein [Devosia sp.]|jgi:hypothetical protein|uniref:hypothetical protein n=1 Tax=Devosia sp. TaxID=1871048 RepID=UPI0037C0065C
MMSVSWMASPTIGRPSPHGPAVGGHRLHRIDHLADRQDRPTNRVDHPAIEGAARQFRQRRKQMALACNGDFERLAERDQGVIGHFHLQIFRRDHRAD